MIGAVHSKCTTQLALLVASFNALPPRPEIYLNDLNDVLIMHMPY